MSCNDYLSLLHREALTLQQIDNMKLKISKSNDHLIHIQEQSDKFMETHNNTLMELETKIKQTELQNESCKVQLEKLDLEIEQAKAKECKRFFSELCLPQEKCYAFLLSGGRASIKNCTR